MKKRQVKIHKFDPIIYPYKIWVVVSDSLDSLSDNFLERDLEEMKFIGDDRKYEAMCCDVRSKEEYKYGSVILFKSRKFMTIPNISHESVHAAKHLFSHIGANINPDEPFEYVVGWIAGCIEKVKLNKNE